MTAAGRAEPFDERESWSEEAWRAFQWNGLRAVIEHAERDLPFYRERFRAAGVSAGDVRTPDDLAKLPVVRKADVIGAMRAAGTYRVGMETADPERPTALGMTTGTVGTAMLTYPEAWRSITGDAAARAYWWAGLRPGMSMLVAAPAWHCLALRQMRVAERIGVRCVVPWGTFLPQYAGPFLDALMDVRPSFVCLFLPMVYALLGECRLRGVSPAAAFASVQSVLLGGAPLTPFARGSLRAQLGIRDLYDSAGSSEGLLAAECSAHDGHHCFVDACHVEVVDPDTLRPLPPGRRGTVILSTLVPHGSVHLRYDTEDVGAILPGACSCGCTWPRLRIYGRRADRIRLRGIELLWYDVRLCVDEVPELTGVPCAVIRGRPDAASLRVLIQRPADGPLAYLDDRLRTLGLSRLGIPLEATWVGELPARWKGVTVIDESTLERADG